jgi:hypothetical protein
VIAWGLTSLAGKTVRAPIDRRGKLHWRMPPIDLLPAPALTRATKVWMSVLRGYLVLAAGLVLVRIAQLAIVGHA